MRVNRESFDARLAEKRPGQLVSLTIFRFDDLSALPIKLAFAEQRSLPDRSGGKAHGRTEAHLSVLAGGRIEEIGDCQLPS